MNIKQLTFFAFINIFGFIIIMAADYDFKANIMHHGVYTAWQLCLFGVIASGCAWLTILTFKNLKD